VNGTASPAALPEREIELLDGLTYAVSHDLRAPIRAVVGYAAVFDEEYGVQLDDEGRRLLSIISREAKRTMAMVDALLEFSGVARQALLAEALDMTAMVREVALELAPGNVEVFTIEPLPEAHGDRALIRRVWSALIANALQATSGRPTPRIRVWATEEPGRVVYHTLDNGIGFDMKYRDQLFAVFQKLHHDRDFPGLGIGLAAVKQIVGRHDGEVWAEGRLDAGATFSFALPTGRAM